MGVDRRTSTKSDNRKTSNPYLVERKVQSLHERIGDVAKQSPVVFPGREKSTGSKRSPPHSDNPLYAYLNGSKPKQSNLFPPNTAIKSVSRRKDERPPRKLVAVSQSYIPNEEDRDRDLQIRGSGASFNMFSIRGASSTSISIKNLAPGTTQSDVCTILNEQVGEVEDCKTFPVRGGLSTTAEVRFGSRIAADKAINILHGVLADNKRLEVTILLIPDPPRSESPPPVAVRSQRSIAQDHDMQDINDKLKTIPQKSSKTQKTIPETGVQRSNPDLFANRVRKPSNNPPSAQQSNARQQADARRVPRSNRPN